MICLVSTVVIHFVFITCHRTCFEGQQRSLSALQPLQRPAESGALPPKAEGQRMIYRETGFMLGFGELNSKSSQKHGENVNQSGLKSIWNLCRKDGCLVAQSCLTLCNLVDCSPPGSSVHELFQARMDCHFLLQVLILAHIKIKRRQSGEVGQNRISTYEMRLYF